MGILSSSVKLVSTTFDTVADTVSKVGTATATASSALQRYATRLDESAKDSLAETREAIRRAELTREEESSIALAEARFKLQQRCISLGIPQEEVDRARADLAKARAAALQK